jgi:hypothetical protein
MNDLEELLINYMGWKREEMSYYSQQTRDGDVALAAIEALEAGITLDQLLKSNKTVRMWYTQTKTERDRQAAIALKEAERQAKLAEKRRLEAEARAAVAAKLTPEELAAFGLTKKGAKK